MEQRTPRKKREDEHFDLIGFAPDLDPTTPGACSVMANVLPISSKGWRAAPSLDRYTSRFSTPTAATAFSQVFFSAGGNVLLRAQSQIISTNQFITAGTATGTLALLTAYPSSFVDFGQYILAANPGHPVAARSTDVVSMHTFVPQAGAPQSMFLTVASRFVVAFDNTDGWACCARDDHSSWTANPATLAAFGRLPGRSDDLNRCAATIGDDIILFKGVSAYLGRFVPNNVEVWVFELLRNVNINASHYTATEYGAGVVVLADDGLYYFDGASLTNLMDERMSRWFARYFVSPSYSNRVIVDEVRDLIWVKAYIYDLDNDPSAGGYSTYVFVCDPRTKRWGRWNGEAIINIEAGKHQYPKHWAGHGYTRTGLRSVWAIPYGTTAVTTIPREIAGAATAAAAAQIVTHDFGHAFIDSELTQANLKFITAPTGATVTAAPMQRNTLDGSLSTAAAVARASNGGFDVRQNARWHRLKFDITGEFEIGGLAVDLKPTGLR